MLINSTFKSKVWRRILITYFLINLFALITSTLFSNVSYLKENKSDSISSEELAELRSQGQSTSYTDDIYYIFAGENENFESPYNKYEHFWPFVKFKTKKTIETWTPQRHLFSKRTTFWGIFKGYDITEFIFFCSIPFIVLLIRKLW